MQTNTVPTTAVQIWMAGDIDQAKQVCREFCFRVGLCATVTPTTFIYTGGEEAGFVVGLIDYPRFPSGREVVLEKAKELAELLLTRLCQHSYTLADGIETTWVTRRDECAAAKG